MLSSSRFRHGRLWSRVAVIVVSLASVPADAPRAAGPLAADFDWAMPPRFRVPALPDPQAPSPEATMYFAGPVAPAHWHVDLDACDSTGSITSFEWEVDGAPLTTTAACDGASFDVDAEGDYAVTLTVTDSDGAMASLTRTVTVKDWLIIGVGDSYGSGEGNPDEPVSPAQINAVATAQSALAAAQSAASTRLAEWAVAEGNLAELIPLVNDAIAKLNAWQAAVAARNDACDNFPPTPVLCADAQAAATAAAGRLVAALTRLGLDALFGTPNLLTAITDLRESAQHALDLAQAALDAARAAVDAAQDTLAQAIAAVGPRWQSQQCHRSAFSGQVQAARMIEEADPHTSVTFIHLACSGATIWKGLLGTYNGQEESAGPPLPPQIESAAALAEGRPIDALVVSIGGNDVGFADVITACMLQDNCSVSADPSPAPVAQAAFSAICAPLGPLDFLCENYFAGLAPFTESGLQIFLGSGTACGGAPGDDADSVGLDDLPCDYTAVQDELETLRTMGTLHGLFESDGRLRLYLTAYPKVTRREPASPGAPTVLCGYDPSAPAAERRMNLPGVTATEMAWAESFVAPTLTDAMAASAEAHGWRFVDAHAAVFDGHGYCADDNWIERIPESVQGQGRLEPLIASIAGSAHPNAAGHQEYARAISHALLCDFYPGCSPTPPTVTTTTTSTSTTSTTLPPTPECLRAEDCGDGNPCTDDACAAGRCQHADNAAPCDDGSVCTAGDACAMGACVPGTPLDAGAVARSLADTRVPAACAGKDARRAKNVLKAAARAGRKLTKAASTTDDRKRGRLITGGTASLAQADARVRKLERKLAPACQAALAELIAGSRERAACLE